jgi:long-subunit acyl-CoA synthetase (AMP-forming)
VYFRPYTGSLLPSLPFTVVCSLDNVHVWWPYCPPEHMDAEDNLFIMYTSGSTGKPKGFLLLMRWILLVEKN